VLKRWMSDEEQFFTVNNEKAKAFYSINIFDFCFTQNNME